MAESKTSVCNQALARLGAVRINDYTDDTDTKPEAIYCRLFFDQTVRALQKDHFWPFAKKRVKLSADTEWAGVDTGNDFQYAYAYHLPSDFLRIILFWNASDLRDGRTNYSYEIEGKRLLTDEAAVYLKYIKNVTDVGAWDSLFTEVMVLILANKLVVPLSQDLEVKEDIARDIAPLLRKVRAMDRMEERVIGRNALRPWNNARYTDFA